MPWPDFSSIFFAAVEQSYLGASKRLATSMPWSCIMASKDRRSRCLANGAAARPGIDKNDKGE
ncbi:MAG: hypothetical protein H6R17_1092 [Proteobacteria bacterium]|nr:hypothetical protein [Pseudomonadota bacterium]